jgi:hypothetical protein
MLSATATGNAAAHVDTYTPPIGHDRLQEQALPICLIITLAAGTSHTIEAG